MKKILDYLRPRASEAKLILPPLQAANLKRILLGALIGPVINLGHIFVFSLALGKGTPLENQWRMGIVLSHGFLFLFFSAFGLVAWRLRARGEAARMAQLTSHAFYLILLLVGVEITLVDQLVTPAMTPYLLVSILAPLAIQLPPRGPIVYHLLAFGLFAGLLVVVQPNADVRLSNQVNGLTGLGVGIFLNLLFWHFNRIRVLQQHRIEHQTKELLEANQTRDRFLSIIAHDLRSPFSGFMNMLELLQANDFQFSKEERADALLVLHQSSVSLYWLLENLLAWSKAQQNLLQVRPMELSLAPFLENVRTTLAGVAGERQVVVEIQAPPGLTMESDPQMLETILRNLLSNALKFTPQGGKVDLSAQPDPESSDSVCFECRDTGVGIPDETLKVLFRLDRPGGLGLILCQDFVGRLGGELLVESRLGRGTRFWFSLPQSRVPSAS